MGTSRCDAGTNQKSVVRWQIEKGVVIVLFGIERCGVDWYRRRQRLSVRFEDVLDEGIRYLSRRCAGTVSAIVFVVVVVILR